MDHVAFVPFIAITEAHGGSLTLENRDTSEWARAVIKLPA
jgi:hypothetical protein